MTQPDWDDDRLAAAFRARFDRPAPPTVSRTIHGAIAGTSPARTDIFWRVPGLGLAAAAVVAVLIGTVAVGLGLFGRSGGAPLASGSGVVPSAIATPTEQALPGSVLDLPIITVSDAIVIRDAGADDRELAVMGWFTPALTGLRCVPPAPVSPVELDCGDSSIWLTHQAESLIHRTATTREVSAPAGPALKPFLDVLDQSWQPADLGIGANGDSTPTDVVFIGHFDDRRAALCLDAEQAACRDRFVVDSVALVEGSPQPRSVMRYVPPTSSVADIESIVANEAPQSPILSMVIIDGNDARLTELEPTLAKAAQVRLIKLPILWVVRVLESERATTYIVVDGTDAIYEMNSEGEPIHVGGTTGDPEVTLGPWPPDGAVIIALTSPVGANDPPVQVAVVDESGRLTGVAEKGAADPSTWRFDGRFGAYAEPGRPGRVHLAWVGGICDSRITVIVADDLGTITFDMGPQPDCDSLGVGRELVLDFDGSVNVPAIEIRDVADALAPVATSPAYQLDCGPLGPDTCEQQAAALVAANVKASPTKRIVSITFTDECMSNTVIFDDGTGMTASIDCILP